MISSPVSVPGVRAAIGLAPPCEPEQQGPRRATESGDEVPGFSLREYLTANYARLHGRLSRHLGCADQASECLHDAWLRLGDLALPEAVKSPEAYVYRTACNLAMDRFRSERPWLAAEASEAAFDHLTDQAPGPDVIAEARSGVEAVERAMHRLPRRHRSVLVALRIDEKSRQEVADWLCISLRSVDTALRLALDQCAEASGRAAPVGVNAQRRDRNS